MAEVALDIVAVEKHVVIRQGDTFESGDIAIKDSAGDDVDLSSGYTAEFGCVDADGASVLDNSVTGENNVVVTLDNGKVSFAILSADTATAAATRAKLQYQLRVEATAGGVKTIVYGFANLVKSVLQPAE